MQNPNLKFKEGEVIPIDTKCQYRVVEYHEERWAEDPCCSCGNYQGHSGCKYADRCTETNFILKKEYFTEAKYEDADTQWPKKGDTVVVGVERLNKYERVINGAKVDIYDILSAYGVDCQAMGHGIKKALMSGKRGYKDSVQDKEEAISSIKRSIEMERATMPK